MWPFNTGDFLTEISTFAGLNVLTHIYVQQNIGNLYNTNRCSQAIVH